MHARGAGWALASCAHARQRRIVWLNFDTPLVRRAPFPPDRLPSQTQVVLLFFDASHYWLFVLLSFAQLCACAVTSRAFSSAATWRLNSALFVVALKLTRFSGGAFRALFDFIFWVLLRRNLLASGARFCVDILSSELDWVRLLNVCYSLVADETTQFF